MIRIESHENATVKRFLRLSREKKFRVSTGEMVCEGEKMLAEALRAGVKVTAVLVREGQDLTATILGAEAQGAKLFSVDDKLTREISEVETPQGILFSCERPVASQLPHIRSAILLDGLQDPGNMGTILRTADAFGLDAVILCEGCTDPTAPKVVRATMGAVFRQRVYQMTMEHAVAVLHEQGVPVYAAALHQDSVPVSRVSLSPAAVVVGNEGNGVQEQTIALCDRSIILPMSGCAESLNAGVAASILIWEMTGKEV